MGVHDRFTIALLNEEDIIVFLSWKLMFFLHISAANTTHRKLFKKLLSLNIIHFQIEK